MALRLIELVLPSSHDEKVRDLLEGLCVIDQWSTALSEEKTLTKTLVSTERAEQVMDEIERRFSGIPDFRLMLLSVEATLPAENAKEAGASTEEAAAPVEKVPLRVSRQELYQDIQMSCGINRVFIAMVVLSTVVAAVGLLRDNTAVMVGAMVIAPLLGPNSALALATTLGDAALARRAAFSNLTGFAIAFAMAISLGFFMSFDPQTPEILSRTEVGLSDIVLALAAGAAGTLAYTSGVSSTLVGVMVAVALLPPTVVFGLLLGAGEISLATGALLLLLTNVFSVNLAGVATFYAQGIQPRHWWEAERARRSTRIAMGVWVLLISILALIISIAFRGETG